VGKLNASKVEFIAVLLFCLEEDALLACWPVKKEEMDWRNGILSPGGNGLW